MPTHKSIYERSNEKSWWAGQRFVVSHGKIGVRAWRFGARLFHYVHPMVLANVMHECTYRTLASHADTCRLDFYEIRRACAFHKGNFLAPCSCRRTRRHGWR